VAVVNRHDLLEENDGSNIASYLWDKSAKIRDAAARFVYQDAFFIEDGKFTTLALIGKQHRKGMRQPVGEKKAEPYEHFTEVRLDVEKCGGGVGLV